MILRELRSIREKMIAMEDKIDRLGRSMEPEDSVFHLKKCDTLVEFLDQEMSLLNEETYRMQVCD